MKPLNGYGRHNPTDTDGIGDKWAGNTPGTDDTKLNPPHESPAVHPDILESGKWSLWNSTLVLHLPPLLSLSLFSLPSVNQDGVQVYPQWLPPALLTVQTTISNPILPLTN